MTLNNTTTSFLAKILLCAAVGLSAVFFTVGTAYAAHPSGSYSTPQSGESICNGAGNAFGTTNPLPNRDGGDAGGGIPGRDFSLHVPVKDFEAENLLRFIANHIDAIERDVDLIQGDTQAIRYYLFQLCRKEYVYDHTIQQAWARVIGEFVKTTQEWVRKVYDGNPIFLTNQTVYYKIADMNVIETFKKEVEVSNIGENAKREILKELERRTPEEFFPYRGDEVLAPDGLAEKLTDPFQFSFEEWNRLMISSSGNISSLAQLALTEFNRKRERMRTYETEKLAWGRGFFSYEICDLELYTTNPVQQTGDPNDPFGIKQGVHDRRNCRIVTPGSLIQDQVSLVFGTAIRQMEAADEFEEWIAKNTIVTLNDILNKTGLDTNLTGTRVPDDPNAWKNTTPISPTEALPLIEEGRVDWPYPAELLDLNEQLNKKVVPLF